ncbi:hypothetical protein GCM10009117_20260 [Gangjinia marincola]|uniref:Phosphatidic acid phosphatase type 2/haloperoxidase domain-containing protein n=1 Tax=Gangjinia marincola TaxID=578463 RepID=A0ABP3XWX3_9FLAO
MKWNKYIILLVVSLLFSACGEKQDLDTNPAQFYALVNEVTNTMVHDIFSPPVASRVYVYPNIAAHEILTLQSDKYSSLAGQLTDLTSIPKPQDPNINLNAAAIIAHHNLSKQLVFTEDIISSYTDSLFRSWEVINKQQFKASKQYAQQVTDHITAWMSKDNYAQTRTMPKFSIQTNDPSRWQPTPPAYIEGIEPNWKKMRTLVLDSAAQFKPEKHPEFSMKENSDFYKELMEVYEVSQSITKNGDQSKEIQIAQFWDCNPYVSVTRGHLMFATKKITPGAHWMGIAEIASKNNQDSLDDAVYAFTKTSIALYDGFISCWDEKYRSNLIRPETLINQHIDEQWKPILQTPPFPEYSSGHSVISGAAATVLTQIYGDNIPFDDDTETKYGLPVRTFKSFNAAAEEAALSRLYGGIHYRAAIDNGLVQGKNVGEHIVKTVKLKKDVLAWEKN